MGSIPSGAAAGITAYGMWSARTGTHSLPLAVLITQGVFDVGSSMRLVEQLSVLPGFVHVLSESIRDHLLVWHSFRSMRRMDARRRNASALRFRHSQSLASRRHRLSHAMVRSTTDCTMLPGGVFAGA